MEISTMLANLKAGQTISCTVTSAPRRSDARDTIERLMRQDPGVKKGLRTAQRKRAQRMVIYNRGNRDWVKRETCARLVTCTKGATWSMTFVPTLAPDLASVEKYLKITPA
jgi:hypothetical protein